jgi:perosamine synthetase
MNDGDSDLDRWKIPLYKIYTDDEDMNLISKIIKRGTQWAMGPEIEEFEKSIKNFVGCDFCVTLNSGTSALHATFLAYGFENGDEIIVPSFSFISTANAAIFVGAKPIFSDIEDINFGLNPELIPDKISNSTKALVPMDYGGLSCRISDIKKIADENNLVLIEDAAESLGATAYGKKVGSMADSSIFSFCGNKVITTGEGGAVVTNSRDIYEKIKQIRSHGRVDKINYFENPSESEYLDVGYNWRMSSITAALGLAQLAKIEKIIQMRQNNAKYISDRLAKHKITIPTPENFTHIYQMYTIRLSNKHMRDNLHTFLLQKKIFTKVYFHPIHLTSFYKEKFGTLSNSLPVTETLSDQVLTLPLYPNMTKEEKDYLVESVNEFFELN